MLRPWQTIDEFLKQLGLKVGAPTLRQTTGGTHERTSLHYLGRARDYGPATGSDPAAIARALEPFAKGPGAPVVELFYQPTGTFYKNGRAFIPSKKLADGHLDHVHVSLDSGIDMRKAVKSAAIGGAALTLLAIGVGIFLASKSH